MGSVARAQGFIESEQIFLYKKCKVLYVYLFMEIVQKATGLQKQIEIEAVSSLDIKVLTKKRYFFSWRLLKDKWDLYKLTIIGEEDILGAMALIDFPGEYRIEIKLICSSRENVGKSKEYEDIVGCMIAYACNQAVIKYGDKTCVSLLPKTEIRAHYMKKYNMFVAGEQLFLESRNLNDIIIKYLR